MHIIALITDAAPIERILGPLREPAEPPRISPARGPPVWGDAPEPMPDWNLLGQPEPGVAFDQHVACCRRLPQAGVLPPSCPVCP